jgi:uroporphyrinogen-III decarboxylase
MLCIGHLTKNETEMRSSNKVLALPEGFVTEAQALGASTKETSGGFVVPSYLYTDPVMLLTIPRIDEQYPIKRILERIQNESSRPVVLKVNGPYSVLASVIEPSLLYRWLKKNPVEVHAALHRITTGLSAYIIQAVMHGAKIISLADPYANPSILGMEHYKKYAGAYLTELLSLVLSQSSTGLIHLCPHSSIPLEKAGYIAAETVPIKSNAPSYIDTLLELVVENTVTLTGHHCIYSASVSGVQSLRILDMECFR